MQHGDLKYRFLARVGVPLMFASFFLALAWALADDPKRAVAQWLLSLL